MSNIDSQDTWRKNYANFPCVEFTSGIGLPAEHRWLAFCCLDVLDMSPQKPLWKVFIKTRLAFSSENDRIALLFQFHQMTHLKTKPSLAPPALLKNSTMCQSPTDMPADTAGSLSSRCIMFIWRRAPLKRPLFPQHIQICCYCHALPGGYQLSIRGDVSIPFC